MTREEQIQKYREQVEVLTDKLILSIDWGVTAHESVRKDVEAKLNALYDALMHLTKQP